MPPKTLKSESKISQYYWFTLSFTYELKYDDDSIYFAHAIPYTYNKNLLGFLDSIRNKGKHYN